MDTRAIRLKLLSDSLMEMSSGFMPW